jgi:hypothetical protein
MMRTPLQQSVKSPGSGQLVESNLQRKRRMLDTMLSKSDEETKSGLQSGVKDDNFTIIEEVDDRKLQQWMKSIANQEGLPRVIACSDDDSSNNQSNDSY